MGVRRGRGPNPAGPAHTREARPGRRGGWREMTLTGETPGQREEPKGRAVCFQKGPPTFVSAKATVPSSSVERSSSFR